MSEHVVLDLFAGHGWGVALKELEVEEHAVEIMKEAVETRAANGMATAYSDVWDVQLAEEIEHDTEVASPPCQAFSVAGKGAGRKALDDVLRAIDEKRFEDIDDLRRFAVSLGDERIGLVLVPLHYAVRFKPKFIVWEQVPPVLPVWEACAEVLRWRGYSVVTDVLTSEMYGVPQTRKRAILIATLDGEAKMPTPTHSRYYSRDPKRLDPGVKKWVSMREALGDRWPVDRPSPTVTGGGLRPEERNRSDAGHGNFWQRRSLVSNYGTGGDSTKRGERGMDEPSSTITSKADRARWTEIWTNRPATTIVQSDVVAGPGRSEFVKGGVSRQNRPGSVKVTIEEAAILQSYPEGFQFAGGKGKQFLQVGNACPPLLSQRLLEQVWGIDAAGACNEVATRSLGEDVAA